MKKAVLLAAILAGAILAQPVSAEAQQTNVVHSVKTVVTTNSGGKRSSLPQVSTVFDRGATASFESVDTTGCLLTDVSLFGGVEVQTQGRTVTQSQQTSLTLRIFDVCQFIGWIDTNTDYSQPVTQKITFGKNGTIHLVASLSLDDNVSLEILPATIDVTWKPTARPVPYHSTTVTDENGVKTTVIIVGTTQPAQASGVILSGGSLFYTPIGNQIPEPSYQAEIDTSDTITITVTH